jgi:peptide deformylase
LNIDIIEVERKLALREIRILGDDILRKKSRIVKEVDEKVLELIEDMKETMIENDGVGIAAPQVGILKRIVIVMNGKEIVPLINPVIVSQEGEEVDVEGCLSVKKQTVTIKRPSKIVVEALNEKGEKISFTAEHYYAREICHEVDHLDGILIVDREECE